MESGNVSCDLPRGEGVTIDDDALYVSHSASLRRAARWLEAVEDSGAAPLAAA
jgi:hypothetical protein